MKSFIISILKIIISKRGMEWIHALRFIYLIKLNKNYEPEIRLISLFLEKGDVAVDVGANGANWTYHISKNVGYQGKIFAFEIDPYYARVTKKTVYLLSLKNVLLFNNGLSNKTEKQFLSIRDYDGNRYRGLSHISYETDRNKSEKIAVTLERLDDLIQKYPKLLNTKLIKCDVEGYELFVLQGAERIIRKSSCAIILEIGHGHRYGYEVKDLFSYLYKRGYDSYVLSLFPIGKNRDEKLKLNQVVGQNVIFLPSKAPFRFQLLKDKLQKISADKL